jgi:hypothetical protein
MQTRMLDRRNRPVRGQRPPERLLGLSHRRLNPRIDVGVAWAARCDSRLCTGTNPDARRLDHQPQSAKAMRLPGG